jgi:hypothetical protein
MNKKIALTFIVLFLFCTVAFAKPLQNKVLGTSQGRFVFGQISDFRRDQFMLDTKTGRLWQVTCITMNSKKSTQDNCITVLQAMPYMDTDGKWSLTPK